MLIECIMGCVEVVNANLQIKSLKRNSKTKFTMKYIIR